MSVRNPQENSSVKRRNVPYPQITGARNKNVIEIICGAAKRVVGHVNLSASLEQAYLVKMTKAAEKADRFLNLHVVPAEGDVLRDDSLHPFLEQT